MTDPASDPRASTAPPDASAAGATNATSAAPGAAATPVPGGIVPAAPELPPDYERRRSDPGGVRGLRLVVLAAAALFILWLARDIIAPFVVAAIIAYAFSPLVSVVEERTNAPRALVIAIGYAITLVAVGALIYLVAGRASTEIRTLTSTGPDIIASALHRLAGDRIEVAGQTVSTDALARSIHDALLNTVSRPTDALHLVTVTVDIALQALLTIILSFYMLLDGARFANFGLRFLDRRRQLRAVEIAHHIHEVLGRWLRGQLFLIGLVSIVLYVALGPILGVPYSLTLAVMSGVLEIIPLVGPLIAGAIAVTVAFGHGGTNLAIIVAVLYVVVRQVEDQLIMPVVIGRAVHLHPAVTIFAVLVGLSTFGVLGGLLGVPVAAAANVTLHELYPEASDEPQFFGLGRGKAGRPAVEPSSRSVEGGD